MEQEKKSESIYKSGFRLFLIIVLFLLMIFLFTGLSTGWFANNKEVTGTGMTANVQGARLQSMEIMKVTYTRTGEASGKKTTLEIAPANNWAAADVLMPGDTIQVLATLTLKPSETDVPTAFSLRIPRDQKNADVPVRVSLGKDAQGTEQFSYNYLSSQIRLDKVTVADAQGTELTLQKAYQTVYQKDLQMLSDHKLGDKNPVTPKADIPLGEVTLAANREKPAAYTVLLELTFVNSLTENQILLRGDPATPANQPVVPSSFWREICADEIF